MIASTPSWTAIGIKGQHASTDMTTEEDDSGMTYSYYPTPVQKT